MLTFPLRFNGRDIKSICLVSPLGHPKGSNPKHFTVQCSQVLTQRLTGTESHPQRTWPNIVSEAQRSELRREMNHRNPDLVDSDPIWNVLRSKSKRKRKRDGEREMGEAAKDGKGNVRANGRSPRGDHKHKTKTENHNNKISGMGFYTYVENAHKKPSHIHIIEGNKNKQ